MMDREILFNSTIPINLSLAREIYREYLSKDYDYIYRTLAEKLRIVWDYRDLNFQPRTGDILSSARNIVMFDKMTEDDKSIMALFVYNKANKTIKKISQPTIRGVEVACGAVDEYVHANNQEREIFFKAMSSLK